MKASPGRVPSSVNNEREKTYLERLQALAEDNGERVDAIDLWREVERWRVVGSESDPTFENSWVNYSTATGVLRFLKDPLGVVHINGVVKTGTPPSVVFTLPPGYRPPQDLYFASIASGPAVAQIDVASTGTVSVTSGSATWTAINLAFMTA